MKRTPMRRKSKKRGGVDVWRRNIIIQLVKDRGGDCEARTSACAGQAVDAHEKLRRGQGGSIVDPANIILVCRECHDYIHAHPAESYESGWLFRSGG